MEQTIVFSEGRREAPLGLASGESQKDSKPRVVGKHIYGNAMNCDVDKLMDEEYIVKTVREAARLGNMTILDLKSWKIGNGVSVLAVVLESHISVHTWPEYGFATIDVYSCGDHTHPQEAFEYIVKKLEAKSVVRGYIDRSFV